MHRYRLTIEYDGTNFAGFQRQAGVETVQSRLETAFAKFDGGPVTVACAGRTDSGVHALGQVIHVDLRKHRPAWMVRNAVNHHVGSARVVAVDCFEARPDFDARRNAIGRSYRYRILCRRAPPALDRGLVWHLAGPLNAEAMHEAAQRLVGHHDFTSFRAAHCQARSPVKSLDRLDVSRHGEEIWIEADARSFLHNQIRILTGTLKLVGEGKWTAEDVATALAARSRDAAGPTAPPTGLCFMEVRYRPETLLAPDDCLGEEQPQRQE
jgi:tRNA pseudouridine38-40 synthase